MKKITLPRLVIATIVGLSVSTQFAIANQVNATPPPESVEIPATYTNAQLDSLLAPIALYPDTLLTHILIASTYPLDVIAANRWRQNNANLTEREVELALEPVGWDPSVKAIAPFENILNTMSEDLNWLQQLGDNVLVNQNRVLARVQVLRQHALEQGALSSNDYLEVSRDREVIVVAPRQPDVVYVPYYDPVVVYGNWWHPVAPVRWYHKRSYHYHRGVYWSPHVSLSTHFYFGGIHWRDRHVVIHRQPVVRYYHGPVHRRVYSNGYQRWNHGNHRTRHSHRVISRERRQVHSYHQPRVTRHTERYGQTYSAPTRHVTVNRSTTPVRHYATTPQVTNPRVRNVERAQPVQPVRVHSQYSKPARDATYSTRRTHTQVQPPRATRHNLPPQSARRTVTHSRNTGRPPKVQRSQ